MSDNFIEEEKAFKLDGFSNEKSGTTGFNTLIAQWWDEFSLRAKLLAIATLVVSLSLIHI